IFVLYLITNKTIMIIMLELTMFKKKILITILIFMFSLQLYSQTKLESDSLNSTIPKFSKAIEDNSFFVEEAYNQEDGVIQHISSLIRDHSKNYFYAFTQEWPFFSQTHQLSATVPFSYFSSNSVSGLGDIYLNYRYQLFGHDDWAAASPRFSIILPTVNAKRGLGEDVTGFEVNLPFSKRLNENFVTHVNLGFTLMPNSETIVSGNQIKKTLTSFNYGVSVIWLMNYNLNFMFEYVGNSLAEFDVKGDVKNNIAHTLVPGLRYAVDIGNLQIVPGLAVPIVIEGKSSKANLLVYLSFEHSI
ncbi:MAG: transporter, partial [Bacteroidetes bacterium]|nr:transporter [Bacteroidota bacterium]MBU1680738.1 transporter [Bacteroidota bacterium]